MGLRGLKITSGIDCWHIHMDLTCNLKVKPGILFTFLTTPTPQVLGCLFYAYYVFVRLCIPQFRSISLQLFDLRAMVLCVFNSILPGMILVKNLRALEMRAILQLFGEKSCLLAGVLILFLGFFAFLHCWLNAFAEMLRFADRMFYKVLLLRSF